MPHATCHMPHVTHTQHTHTHTMCYYYYCYYYYYYCLISTSQYLMSFINMFVRHSFFILFSLFFVFIWLYNYILSFCFVSFRFVLFRFVSFRFVLFLLLLLLLLLWSFNNSNGRSSCRTYLPTNGDWFVEK